MLSSARWGSAEKGLARRKSRRPFHDASRRRDVEGEIMSAGTLERIEMDASADPVRVTRMRIESVDVVRGVIMILMALDHTRDYFGDVNSSPTRLATTTAALFFTRWITHICAPTFALLTG